MKGENIKRLKQSLESQDWTELIGKGDVNASFEFFHTVLLSRLDEHCPEKIITISNKSVIREPWLFKGLIKSTEWQKELYKIFIKARNEANEQKYKDYRNMLQQILQIQKRNYYREQCIKYTSNTKQLWQMINQITKRQNDKSTVIDRIKIDNIEKTSANAITNGLGKYFSTIGNKFAAEIGPSTKNIETYVDAITRNPKSVFLSPYTETKIKEIYLKYLVLNS